VYPVWIANYHALSGNELLKNLRRACSGKEVGCWIICIICIICDSRTLSLRSYNLRFSYPDHYFYYSTTTSIIRPLLLLLLFDFYFYYSTSTSIIRPLLLLFDHYYYYYSTTTTTIIPPLLLLFHHYYFNHSTTTGRLRSSSPVVLSPVFFTRGETSELWDTCSHFEKITKIL
jgi:hypothetical protein